MTDLIKQKILKFLNRYEVGVLSTINLETNSPESAVVGFANTQHLEIIFGTSHETRKYKNLKTNSNVSFVVGWESEIGTIQYEGTARELEGEEAKKYSDILIAKNPESETYVSEITQRYFLICPTWIRFLDNAGNPPDVYEETF